MSFLNLSLLAGAVAFTIPLAIHLLNRSRFEVRNWGAMHLLDAAMEVNSRRVEWQSLLLLLLRCLIPVLLAAALARPTLRSFQAGRLDQKTALGVVLDDSFSMDDSSGLELDQASSTTSAWQKAKRAAERLLQQRSKSPKVVLTTSNFADSSRHYLGTDSVLAANALQKFHPTAGYSDPVAAISNCVKQLKASSLVATPAGQIVIISDFRAADWLRPNIRASLLQLRESNPSFDFTLLSTGKPLDAQTGNGWSQASVHFGTVVPDRQFQNQPFDVPIEVRNWNLENQLKTTLTVNMDSNEVLTQELEIEAGGVFQGSVRLQVPEAGMRILRAELDIEDRWPQDNIAFHCLDIEQPIPILRVTNQTSKGETDYLRTALMPFKESEQAQNTFTMENVRPNQLADQLQQAKSNSDGDSSNATKPIVLLDGVRRLNDEVANELANYVRGGGKLIIAANPVLDLDWFNEQWTTKQQLASYHFSPIADHEPALQLLGTDSSTDVRSIWDSTVLDQASQITFARSMPLVRSSEVEANVDSLNPGHQTNSPDRDVLLSNGSRLLSLQQVGEGRVLQLGFRFEPEWTNLTQLPEIVPLAQQIFFAMSQNLSPPHSQAGGVLHWRAQPDSTYTVSFANHDELSFTFSGEVTSTEAGDLTFTGAMTAGLYRVESTNKPGSNNAPLTTLPPRSVFALRGESDPKRLTTPELRDLANALDATVARSAEDVQSQTVQAQNGRELWRLLILGVLVALVLESWFAGRLTGGTPARISGTSRAGSQPNWEVK